MEAGSPLPCPPVKLQASTVVTAVYPYSSNELPQQVSKKHLAHSYYSSWYFQYIFSTFHHHSHPLFSLDHPQKHGQWTQHYGRVVRNAGARLFGVVHLDIILSSLAKNQLQKKTHFTRIKLNSIAKEGNNGRNTEKHYWLLHFTIFFTMENRKITA